MLRAVSIVVAKLGDLKLICFNPVSHAVLVIDAPGSVTCKCMLQGFGLANTCIGIALGGFDETNCLFAL